MSRVLANKSFKGHLGAQFFGAFNDNLFKQLILFLAARILFPGEDQQGLAFAVFALPFILFSSIAGDLSERYSKRRIIVGMKLAELGIMIVGAIALQMMSWPFMLGVLFIMGAQSAFFGPAKYGVIPEIVDEHAEGGNELLRANGLITMTTFLAILLGQALAGPLLDIFPDRLWVTGAACAGFALVGIVLALRIDPLEPVEPESHVHANPFAGVIDSLKELASDARGVVVMLFLNSLFWFNGGVIQQAITGLAGEDYLAIPKDENWRISLLLVVLALAIIVGSALVPQAAKLVPRGKLVIGGAVTILVMEWSLALIASHLGADGYIPAAVALAVLGFGGAFFAVPVQTFLQEAPTPGRRGKAFAVNNFLNFILIFLAGGWYLGATAIDLHPGVAMGLAGVVQVGLVLIFARTVLRMDVHESDAAS